MTAYQGLESSMPRVKVPRCYKLTAKLWGELHRSLPDQHLQVLASMPRRVGCGQTCPGFARYSGTACALAWPDR